MIDLEMAFLHVFIASRTTMYSVFFIRRWHSLQLGRRSTFISPRTGFNSVCIRKESCTPCHDKTVYVGVTIFARCFLSAC